MKIVVLDGYTLNPGDLSWKGFEGLGELTVYDRTEESLILERSMGADALITNKTVISAETIAAIPTLSYIGVLATGYNVVDVAAAKAKGIPFANIPNYGTRSVAQMVFAHLLNLDHHVADHSATVKNGNRAHARHACSLIFKC